MRTPRLATVLVVFALTTGVAGCSQSSKAADGSTNVSTPNASATVSSSTTATAGSSASATTQLPTAPQLFAAFKAHASEVKSAHAKGTMISKGVQSQIDVSGTVDGSNARLQMTDRGRTLTVLVVNGQAYVKSSAEYWKEQGAGAAADRLGKKWVTMPPSELGKGANVGSLMNLILTEKTLNVLNAASTTVTASTSNGVATYVAARKVGGYDTSITFSADGKARLLRVLSVDPKEGGDLTFTEYDAVKPFAAPAATDIIKLG